MCVIDKKHSLRNIMFRTEFSQKFLRQCYCCGCKQPKMEEFIRLWINCGVQPVLLTIDPDHRLIQRNMIRACIAGGLLICFLNPVMNPFP